MGSIIGVLARESVKGMKMSTMKLVPHGTLISPFSNEQGDYSEYPVTLREWRQIEALQPHLDSFPTDQGLAQEVVSPYIPEKVISSAIEWFSLKLTKKIKSLGQDRVTILYNLEGGSWFFNDVAHVCRGQGLDITPLSHSIQISTSTGYKAYGEVNQDKLRWLTNPALLKDKVVFSLDDVGDSGRTQDYIRRRALADQAKRVITVNMIEKMRVDIAKQDQPDYALLLAHNRFLLGKGLDAGSNRQERELAFRNLSMIPELTTVVVQPPPVLH